MLFGSTLRRALFSQPARRRWTVAFALLSGIVVVLALKPSSGGSPLLGWDKADHMAAFATLAVCGVYGLRGRPAAPQRLWLGLLLLGIGIEFGQMLVPGRSADWRDVAADAAGIGIGMLLAQWVATRLERRAKPRPETPGA